MSDGVRHGEQGRRIASLECLIQLAARLAYLTSAGQLFKVMGHVS
jgi:hypothetical protein